MKGDTAEERPGRELRVSFHGLLTIRASCSRLVHRYRFTVLLLEWTRSVAVGSVGLSKVVFIVYWVGRSPGNRQPGWLARVFMSLSWANKGDLDI